jgi:hypothetical protein
MKLRGTELSLEQSFIPLYTQTKKNNQWILTLAKKNISIVEHFEHNKLVSNFFTTKCSTPL